MYEACAFGRAGLRLAHRIVGDEDDSDEDELEDGGEDDELAPEEDVDDDDEVESFFVGLLQKMQQRLPQ